ncbi:MAG: MMPL family transporter [Flavobacteriales bacterium]
MASRTLLRSLGIALLVFTIWSAWGLSRLQYTYDIDRFFPQDDPAVTHYAAHKARFGDELRVLVVGLELPDGLNADALHRVALLTDTLEQLPVVEAVRSLSTLSEPFRMPMGEWVNAPFFNEPYSDYEAGAERLAQREALRGIFLGRAGKATALVLTLAPSLTSAEGSVALEAILSRVARAGLVAHYAGRIATQQHYLKATRRQLIGLGTAALLLMLVVLFILFRCPVTALSPLLISALALVWTLGPLGWLGVGIEPLLSLLPTLLLVLGSAFSIHIVTRFREHRRGGMDRPAAMRAALSDTRRANALSAMSTAIGFATLALHPIAPLQVFGLAAAWGMLAAWLAARLVLPMLTKHLSDPPKQAKAHMSLQVGPQAYRYAPWFAGIVLLAGIAAIPHLQVNNHFLDDLDSSSALGRDVSFFEERFSGTRPLEIGIVPTRVGTTLLEPAQLHAIDTLARALRQRLSIALPLSPADLARAAMRGNHLGDALPSDGNETRRVRSTLKRALHTGATIGLLDSSFTHGRITGRLPDIGSVAFAAHMDALEPLLRNAHITATVTGGAWLMDLANRRIADVLVYGMLAAVLLNALLITLVLRSPRLGLFSILPNLVPLATVALLMWAFGIPLKVGTAMVFPILYGIALDDTMHVLMHPAAQGGRKGMLHAVRELLPSLRNTTLVVSLGFALFVFSSFPSIAVFGILTAIGLWAALAADVWLLPALASERGREIPLHDIRTIPA